MVRRYVSNLCWCVQVCQEHRFRMFSGKYYLDCRFMGKIIDGDFKKKVDFSEQVSGFQTLMNKAIQVTVSGVVACLSQPLVTMQKMTWAQWESVGDQSPYISELHGLLTRDVGLVAAMLSRDYHTFFCGQLARAFVPVFVQSLYMCRRINELGAQQLQLDAHHLKTVLLEVPSMGVPPERSRRLPASYAKFVAKQLAQAEALLKTLASNRPVHTFHTLLPRGHSDDLRSILELKGIRKADQQTSLAEYANMV
eukprot:747884_1